MKTIRLSLLLLIPAFCVNALAQSISVHPTPVNPADKTYVDMSKEKNQAQMFQACQAELKVALQDPEKYIEAKTDKIHKLLANNETLAYWETYALSQILKSGMVTDPNKIFTLSKTTTDILEVINEEIQNNNKTKNTWGFVYAVTDFVHGLFHVADKKEADATQLIEILSNIAIGYGEKALDINNELERPTQEEQPLLLNMNIEMSRSRGIAAIQQTGMILDYNLSSAALEALAHIAGSEKQRIADPKKIEAIKALEHLAYYNPLALEPHPDCVVDIQRSDRNCIAKKQAQAVGYIGMLGDVDFLTEYMKFGSNKDAINIAATYLGKEAPYPYYGLLNGVNNLITTLKDFAIMTSSSGISWESIPFSDGPSWAETKLINPGNMNAFSEVPELNYTINPSIGGTAIATLQIPTMAESIPFISTQWWTIPEALKSAEMIKALFYIVRVVPSVALLMDGSTIYKIDAINKKVIVLSNPSEIDKTKSYVTVTVTLADGKTLKYMIWTTDANDRQNIIDYTKSSSSINPGVKIDVKYSDNHLPAAQIQSPALTPRSISKLAATTNISNNISLQTENRINSLLKNSNLSFKEQFDILNAFKSRSSLSSPKVLTKFMDGNAIYSNVEVFTNPNGATALKIVRGLTSSDGIINFVRNFIYDVNGKLVEKDSIDYADGSGSIALDSETAETLESDISQYNNFCKNFTPKID